MHGTISDLLTGKPIPGAVLDIWQASANNLRGKFTADDKGRLMDRHSMRPAHIHTMVTRPDSRTCTAQLYPKDDPWLETDTVFAVKKDLVVDLRPYEDSYAGG
ncbi:hypothetical protein E4U42_000790 [Claviceps africana]|uniref:Intradiol ring-cleavage dioxygenases domain-containing protein n=1 Tax=Claviceps africana TaxID=83212 RepID=A0A8K0JAD1_9HYPO|nr:hypothetical protein E4U42_000790 [Claviceps africana]